MGIERVVWRRERALNKRFNTGPASLAEAPEVGTLLKVQALFRRRVTMPKGTVLPNDVTPPE
jgi:hypothetical protein